MENWSDGRSLEMWKNGQAQQVVRPAAVFREREFEADTLGGTLKRRATSQQNAKVLTSKVLRARRVPVDRFRGTGDNG